MSLRLNLAYISPLTVFSNYTMGFISSSAAQIFPFYSETISSLKNPAVVEKSQEESPRAKPHLYGYENIQKRYPASAEKGIPVPLWG